MNKRTLLSTLGITVALLTLLSLPASAQYQRTDLVTNQGITGTLKDSDLVNAWGLTALGGSPFWISDNVTGLSTLYRITNDPAKGTSASKVLTLIVTIPFADGRLGTPSGIVSNPTSGFVFKDTTSGKTAKALFIFDTLDGTISAWNGTSTAATITANLKDGASYTGLAIGTNNGQPFLFAADDSANRRVDVFDANFNFVDWGPDAFSDPKIPNNFTPYGIQTITAADGTETVWVTYTALNKAQSGFVDSFSTGGVLLSHFALQGPLHSPWGVAQAPADFGPMSNAILVSNNTSRGRINAFDPNTGEFLGPLRDVTGQPIEIDQLWGIRFGTTGSNGLPNQLFFTAGSNEYLDGAFGVITVAP